MPPRKLHFVGWLVFLALLVHPGVAGAWIETSVRSHQARVEVSVDGKAIIRHELVLKVRGGPMKSLEISGIGQDIEALPDAVVRRATKGSSSKWPLNVSALEDGGVRLAIGAPRGIRGGSYRFSFAYSVDLQALGLIVPSSEGVELTWIGPRLSTGVDSAKVIFVVPRGNAIPKLGESDSESAGVLLGDVRRGAEFDEVELVRAHLATGEPAVWKVEVSPDAMSKMNWPSDEGKRLSTLSRDGSHSPSTVLDRVPRRELFIGALLGVFYGLLVFFKGHWTVRAASLVEARAKPLIPGVPWLRGVVSALMVFFGVWFALDQEPWLSVSFATCALVGSTHLLPAREARPRGPGLWKPVPQHEARAKTVLPGGVFETTTAKGFAFFVLLLGPIVLGAFRILPNSNYLALMTSVLAFLLVPLFWTGRLKDLPRGACEQAHPWQRFLSRALDPRVATVELWGRIPAAGEAVEEGFNVTPQCDEARLRVVLAEPPPGLKALELSLDEAAGSCVLPCIVVRVLEDSPSQHCLPREIPWQRGRSPEERVALLRPAAPTRAQVLRLIKSLVANLRGAKRVSAHPSTMSKALQGIVGTLSSTPDGDMRREASQI